MTLLLRTSSDLAGISDDVAWIATTGTAPASVGRPQKLAQPARRLHAAFDEIGQDWWGLAQRLANGPGAQYSHALTCAAMNSDLGVMLAWSRLAGELAADERVVLMLCDDGFLFRHLSDLPGVEAGRPPRLWPGRVRRWLRGLLARTRHGGRTAYAALVLRSSRRPHRKSHRKSGGASDGTCLIVYGHPHSGAGQDAYFGTLMADLPGLTHVLHTDCSLATARRLGAETAATSLHGWGSAWAALGGLTTRWRPTGVELAGPHGWLIRRAAELEGSGAAAAASRWQTLCQAAWLDGVHPKAVVWPWENHPWERALVHAAHQRGIATVGYQHTVVSKHIFNYSPKSNPDGIKGLPQSVLCNGPAFRRQLEALGVPKDRLAVGGAFRIQIAETSNFDATGPVFVALSNDAEICRQMMAAVVDAAGPGRHFLIKDHPMYPYAISETEAIRATSVPLTEQGAVSAVLYSTGTVGLEALLFGLPTLRFLPEARIAADILPPGLAPVIVDAETLDGALDSLDPPPAVPRDSVISPVDLSVWRRYLPAA